MRTLVLSLAAALLCSCASLERSGPDVAALKTDVKVGTQKVASATARGAEAVGDSVGTAYRGVKQGFAEPQGGDYGPYPRDYVSTIRRHMLRFEGVSQGASFQFGEPVRAYLNKGLLLGGEVDWQGWVVDLRVETKTRLGQPQLEEYVVRMRDGEIVEVVEKAYAEAFRRIGGNPPAAAAAPRR